MNGKQYVNKGYKCFNYKYNIAYKLNLYFKH